jgi:hypothetical protein
MVYRIYPHIFSHPHISFFLLVRGSFLFAVLVES